MTRLGRSLQWGIVRHSRHFVMEFDSLALRLDANDSFRNEGGKKLFLANPTIFRKLIISVSHTGKYFGVAQVYNIYCPDSGSDNISRFLNFSVIDDNFFVRAFECLLINFLSL